MPEYTQKVKFYREFTISAKNAEEATRKLESLIDEVEFSADVRTDTWYPFEDEETCEDE